MKAATDFSAS